jgi:hypothetical protein
VFQGQPITQDRCDAELANHFTFEKSSIQDMENIIKIMMPGIPSVRLN